MWIQTETTSCAMAAMRVHSGSRGKLICLIIISLSGICSMADKFSGNAFGSVHQSEVAEVQHKSLLRQRALDAVFDEDDVFGDEEETLAEEACPDSTDGCSFSYTKFENAKLFIGLYIGLTTTLSWLLRRFEHLYLLTPHGMKRKSQRFAAISAELLDKTKIHWDKGSPFKDFWFYQCNNHPVVAMAFVDINHPVGPWKRRFIFVFTEAVTIYFVYIARSLWDVDEYYLRLVFLILILGPINGISNFILYKLYSCPCLHEKMKKYDRDVSCLKFRQTVDALGVLITLPLIALCPISLHHTVILMATTKESQVPIDVSNMIVIYLLAHYSRWIGFPALDFLTKWNTNPKYRYRLKVCGFTLLDIGVYQDAIEKHGTQETISPDGMSEVEMFGNKLPGKHVFPKKHLAHVKPELPHDTLNESTPLSLSRSGSFDQENGRRATVEK